MTTSRSIAFWREFKNGRRDIHVIATTKTEDPDAPVELVRPYGDGSGDEVLVSLSREQWAELIGFIREHASTETPAPDPDRWVDLDRLTAIKWHDKVIDAAEVAFISRGKEVS